MATNISHLVCSLAHRDEEKFYKPCQVGPKIKMSKEMVRRFSIITRSNWQKNLLEKQLKVARYSADLELNSH